MLKNCQNCGKEFNTYPSRVRFGKAKFCSVSCTNLPKVNKTCERCGVRFSVISSRIDARFCSKACSIRGKITKICEVCHDNFLVYPAFHKARFCSMKCKGISFRGKPSPMKGRKNPAASKNPQIFKKGFTPWNKGKPHMRGSKHPNWKGGIDLEHERIRHSEEYKRWQQEVYRNGRWTCLDCGYKGRQIVAHHIKSFAEYPKLRFRVSNGVVLCRSCHQLRHKPRRKDYYEKRII